MQFSLFNDTLDNVSEREASNVRIKRRFRDTGFSNGTTEEQQQTKPGVV